MNALNRKKVIKGICFILIFLVTFWYLQELLRAKWIANDEETSAATSTWMEYRSLEPDTVDVLFLGSSHVYSGIDPMYIYDKTGITSFVLAGPATTLDLSCMALEEALKTQKPKVVFLDMSALQYTEPQGEGRCHKIADQMPISGSKIEYAFHNGNEKLKPLDVLFPFFRYHARWSDLKKKDFRYMNGELQTTAYRGHHISYLSQEAQYHFYEKMDYVPLERNLKFVERFKEICDKAGSDVVFFKLPSPEWYESSSRYSEELAQTLGASWLELFYAADEIGLDLNQDFRDNEDHLNQIGAEKVCDYLIGYIQANYDLHDQRLENQRWNDDLALYEKAISRIWKKSSEKGEQ